MHKTIAAAFLALWTASAFGQAAAARAGAAGYFPHLDLQHQLDHLRLRGQLPDLWRRD